MAKETATPAPAGTKAEKKPEKKAVEERLLENGKLEKTAERIFLSRAFPFDMPLEYISVLDRDKKEIGISAVRGGTIVGEHEIIFAGHDEVMEIRHTALSREIFAQGAVEAAKFMAGVKAPGLYDMSSLIR